MSLAADGSHEPIPASLTNIQNANWMGSIPIVLSLAESSLSSPKSPRPLYKMLPRMTHLHIGLHAEVLQLFEYAPASGLSFAATGKSVTFREEPLDDDLLTSEQQSGDDGTSEREHATSDKTDGKEILNKEDNNSKQFHRYDHYPICWFQDEETGEPLRWHLFVGVLYDLTKGNAIVRHSSMAGLASGSIHRNLIPWKLKLHFTAYPEALLSLDDGTPWTFSKGGNDQQTDRATKSHIHSVIGRMFRNSLKQSLFMQYNSSKVAMSITKSSHEKMWNAILNTNFASYHEVNIDLQVGINEPFGIPPSASITSPSKELQSSMPTLVPVRVMLNNKPAMQKPCHAFSNDTAWNKSNDPHNTEIEPCDSSIMALNNSVKHRSKFSSFSWTTLGDVLVNWLPEYFVSESGVTTTVSDSSIYYCVQGIQPCMSCPIVDLWKSLCHPDQFLYIIVVAKYH